MAIQNLPVEIQVAIQQGFLEKEFHDGLESVLAFTDVAKKEDIPMNVGETITKTQTGLMETVTSPLLPSANTGLDNGLTDSKWGVEQYVLTMNHYAATTSLNHVQQHVAIAPLAIENSKKLAIQAKQSMDRLARNELFKNHLGGNTSVRVTLGAPSATLQVEDIRGFDKVYSPTGVVLSVSPANPLTVTIGSGVYEVIGVAADATNNAFDKLWLFNPKAGADNSHVAKSGVLTLSSNVSVSDGIAGNAVIAATAPSVVRSGDKATTKGLIATDLLKIQTILKAVSVMRSNNVPDINGAYNLFLSPAHLLELFQDPEFQMLYRGQFGSETYRKANIFELAGVRFVQTTELPNQMVNGVAVKRAILVGEGCLIEGRFAGLVKGTGNYQGDGTITVKDGIAFIVREPLDRLQQQVTMSWSTIKGFACPTDILANSSFIPTANNSYYKRAIVIESA